MDRDAHSHEHRHIDGTAHAHEHGHGTDHDHDRPARARRGEPTGPTRSVRLPAALDRWFEERLRLHPDRSASELLLELIHGGLRLREGYMPVHRRTLERLIARGDERACADYLRALFDTFGQEYVEHLQAWLGADGFEIDWVTRSSSRE